MPLDYGDFKPEKETNFSYKRTIYVCDTGNICVEDKHFRQTFSPEEFVALLKNIAIKKDMLKNRCLPVLSPQKRFNKLCELTLAIAFCLFLAGCAKTTSTPSGELRVVSVGGAVTETIYALKEEAKIVGADTSSIYPEAATKLPRVGYQRTLAAEGVLSLKPNLVIGTEDTGPPTAIQQIEQGGVKFLKANSEYSVEGAKTKIREIAKALDAEERGEGLIKKLDDDISAAKPCVEKSSANPKKVVFVYARGAGAANVAGTKTTGDSMITLAGGKNAVTGFDGYKPLTPEAMVAAQPDVILLPKMGLDALGGIDALLALPGVAETPAGKNRRIVTVDDLILLGFGPRLGEGVKDLCEKLQP